MLFIGKIFENIYRIIQVKIYFVDSLLFEGINFGKFSENYSFKDIRKFLVK